MSASIKLPGRMTVDEFLVWHPDDGERYELVDGEPRAMAPASEPHGRIQAELARLLGNHLAERGSPCAVVTAAGVQPRVRAATNVRIPDLIVTCAAPRSEAILAVDPVIAVEILSPGNEGQTWTNVWTYTTIPSLREILCIRIASVCAELIRRRADGSWPDDPETIESGELALESVDFRCDVAALYRTTHLAVGR